MKKYIYLSLLGLLLMFCSCSGGDYRDAIPANCTALISINAMDNEVGNRLSSLRDLLHISDPRECGIDFREKLYLFETSDGNFGFCGKVYDADRVNTMMQNCVKAGGAKEGPERQGCHFYILSDSWIVGWTSSTALIMGPVLSASQGEMMQQMTEYLKQGDDDGMVGSNMMDQLDSQKGAMSIVAQAAALPEKIASVITIGLPKDADASQCIISADVTIKNGLLHLAGQPMSFNKKIDEELKSSYEVFRPIKGNYIPMLSKKSIAGMFANVNGEKFLPILQQSEGVLMLLSAVNTAIDINAIMKSIDGELLIAAPRFTEQGVALAMGAQLANKNFLGDVDYWKSSVPEGGKISDWKTDAYYYADKTMSYYFGVDNSKGSLQLYSGMSADDATACLQPSSSPLDKEIQDIIRGNRLAVVVSLSALMPEGGGIASMMLPKIMNLSNIVYTVK